MDVTSEGVVINFTIGMDESADILLTKDGFTVDNTDQITSSSLEQMDYCYYLIPSNRGYSEDRVTDTFKKYNLGDYVKTDYPETVYNLTYNEPESVNTEDTELYERVDNKLTENVLKYFKLNADEYEYEEIYKQKEPECTVEVTFRLYLCSSDYAVQVVRVLKKENENG